MVRVKKLIHGLITVLAVLVLVAGVLFAFRNQTPVSLDFLITQTPEWPVVIWLVLSFLIGVVLGVLGMLRGFMRARLAQRRAEHKQQKADKASRERREAPRGL